MKKIAIGVYLKMRSKILLFILSLSVIMLSDCTACREREPDFNPNKCTKYACPIHPDITAVTSGKCPTCNEPLIPLLDSLKKDTTLPAKQ